MHAADRRLHQSRGDLGWNAQAVTVGCEDRQQPIEGGAPLLLAKLGELGAEAFNLFLRWATLAAAVPVDGSKHLDPMLPFQCPTTSDSHHLGDPILQRETEVDRRKRLAGVRRPG